MYPVISTLRRLAMNVIYVEPLLLSDRGDQRVVAASNQLSYLNPLTGWQRGDAVELFLLRAPGSTPAQRAARLTRYENHLVTRHNLLRADFTLLMGLESEDVIDGEPFRTCRLGVVNGLYRLQGVLIRPQVEHRARVSFGKLPEGVTVQKG